MVDLSDYYFYEINHTDNQEDWHFNITAKHRNKILFDGEVTVKFDKHNSAYFLTKNNKSFTLDCIHNYIKIKLIPYAENEIFLSSIYDNYTICCTKTPFKLIDAK